MNKQILMAALVAAMSLNANAQEHQGISQEQMQEMAAERIEKQADRLAKDLELKGEKKENFLKLYKEYQTATMEARMQERREQDQGQKRMKDMNEEEAKAKMEEYFVRQEQQVAQMQKRLELSREYYGKMQEFLTQKQLLRVFTQQRQGQQGGQQRGQGFGGQRPMGGGFGGQHPMGGGNGGFGGDF